MALRLLRCDCGHRMRFGSVRCGRCHAPASILNHRETGGLCGCIAAGLLVLLFVLAGFETGALFLAALAFGCLATLMLTR